MQYVLHEACILQIRIEVDEDEGDEEEEGEDEEEEEEEEEEEDVPEIVIVGRYFYTTHAYCSNNYWSYSYIICIINLLSCKYRFR